MLLTHPPMTPGAPRRWAAETFDGKTLYVYATSFRAANAKLAAANAPKGTPIRPADQRDMGSFVTDARKTS